jgi:rRNA maturation endonuclease Nob1
METGPAQLHEHAHDLTDLVGQGFSWAIYALAAVAVVIGGILLAKYIVVKLSPRRLCDSCNRYYSTKKSVCPFCGAAVNQESGNETSQNH